MLLSAENISKSYSEKSLLKDVSLYIDKGDKIGVIGVNGAGKSTFLRILAQIEDPDRGTVTKYSGVRLEYLPQNPIWNEKLTVMEHIFSDIPELKDIMEFEARKILTQLGITDFDMLIGSLSGGRRKCIAIAAALIHPCDILILDEPTNHLDVNMIQWLEEYLLKFAGAIVMVTHDRYFLDRVANKIAEIDGGRLYNYPANYTVYLELKEQREERELGTERKRQSILRKELEWIRRGPRARGTKSKDRIARFEELSEKSAPTEALKPELSSPSSRLGKKTIELRDISVNLGGKQLISHFDHMFMRDARVGIVGKSGIGKSTLLNIISGRLKPDSGEVIVGDTVKIGYFSQNAQELDLNCRVIDYIKDCSGAAAADGTLRVSQMLEQYLFTPDLQRSMISRISGGERRRLFLLGVMMQAPNFLLLDEPTNDLDIHTLAVLEEHLINFKGAVIVVSHDRYFLDKVTDTVFDFSGNGDIKKYLGSYSEYRESANVVQTADRSSRVPERAGSGGNEKKLRFTFKEQREFENIDSDIAELEKEAVVLDLQMEESASDYIRLQELMSRKEELDKKLEAKLERWIYLNDLAEKIARGEK
ncbi:MAG: ABC-F family ATP-binding cassette domain-containing protein [Clostridiales bacterium]|nr:ABC-F family ATP-binding cassette domain-containing protein [Clostridiales bacterium]